MKKLLAIVVGALLAFGVFAACGGEKEIMVVSREDGSGTRTAFQEIIGLKDDELYASSNKVDKTSTVTSTVSATVNAIGYISLGSLGDTVKALAIEGVAATAENIKNNTYKLARPFLVVTKKAAALNHQTADFIKYIQSAEAQRIIVAENYIATHANAPSYDTAENTVEGKVKLNGSTSVGPLMEKLMGEYVKLQSGVTFEKAETGSGTGIATASGDADIVGMSSRELNADEKEALDEIELCRDGIAVIVHKNNAIDSISPENLKKIYTGEIRKFSEIQA